MVGQYEDETSCSAAAVTCLIPNNVDNSKNKSNRQLLVRTSDDYSIFLSN